jgi:PAS domain S-box-containing protein
MSNLTPAERLNHMWRIAQQTVLWATALFVIGTVWRAMAHDTDWLSLAASRALTVGAALSVAAVSIWVVSTLAYRPSCMPLLTLGAGLLVFWQLTYMFEAIAGLHPGQNLRATQSAAGWSGFALMLAAFNLALVEAAIARARLEHESAELRREVAQRTEAEDALRAARDQLEERVATRTVELREANEQLRQEVAEHARTADSLQRSESRFRHITTSTGEWIWEMDAFGRFTYCSQAVSDLLGYTPEEAVGSAYSRFLAPGEAAPLPGPGDAQGSVRIARWHLHRNGRPLLLQSAVATVTDAGGMILAYRGATRDITLQHQLERQVEQTRNMELVGQLSSGVAHDFNNLVGVMLGCCNSVRQAIGAEHTAQKMLDVLEEAARHATEVTQSLLMLGSHRPVEMQPVDLAATLEQTRRLLQHLLPGDILLEIVAPASPVWVQADVTQLQQVLLNLSVNARDAMPDGGQLKIQLSLLASEQLRDPPVPSKATCYARIDITDTGCGIPPETQARIFDPFYTTKARGQGAGLGLAIVDSIIKNHGGWIRVRSAHGQGATFSLFLPGVAAPAGEGAAQAPRAARADVGLLLSPEHRLMRGVAAARLRAQGHRVVTLSGVEDLLRTLKRDPTAIRLVVADNGQAQVLWEQWPAIRACQANLLLLLLADSAEPPPPEDVRMLSLSLPFDAARFSQSVDAILSGSDGRDDEHHRSAGGRSRPVAADAGVSPESGA